MRDRTPPARGRGRGGVGCSSGGRPRVLDFGIARLAEPAPQPWTGPEVTADLHLTTSGALLGTPAYMAPEQFAGVGVEARSDQFSFCVALWEALHGEQPFVGDSVTALTESVMCGALREPPREPRVPERVHGGCCAAASPSRPRTASPTWPPCCWRSPPAP